MNKEHEFIDVRYDYFHKKFLRKTLKNKKGGYDSTYSFSLIEVDEHEFPIYKKEITSANILEAVAGTTGFRGGDSGNGCRTFIRIKDLGSTDIRIKKTDSYDEGVEIILGGDSELNTIIDAFRFIADVLEKQSTNCSAKHR